LHKEHALAVCWLLILFSAERIYMARIVMKFGGTSVANIERIKNVARHVKREVDNGHEVAVLHDAREYDAIVASGEQVTSGLLAIALQDIGINARSWQGWQIPIKTDGAHGAARILDIDGSELIRRFGEGQVAVIAGFQGIAPDGRLSTLGRGGSDTSAIFIPTLTASTPPIRALSQKPVASPKFRLKKCWKWPRSAQRFCKYARLNLRWSIKCAPLCARPSQILMHRA
jgi:Amino acid kinase family